MNKFFRSRIALAAGLCGLIGSFAPASAQDFSYVVNPHRVQVTTSPGVKPDGIPKCPQPAPVPTAPIIYCYPPPYIWVAYNVLPLFENGITGAGQTIVVIDAYGSPTITQDLQAFDTVFGLPDPEFDIVCPLGCPTFNPNNVPQAEANWSFETSLDVQWTHAMAPSAKIVLVVAPSPRGDSINLAIQYAVEHYPGAIISQSFGTPEGGIRGNKAQWQAAHQNFVNAQANGITVLAASGDFGSSNGSFSFANPDFPASDPLVLGVGGTQGLPIGNLVTLSGSCTPPSISVCIPTGYGAEQVWNESWISPPGASGGALSLLFPAPSYQSGLGYANRAVPDVAFNAAVDGGVFVAYSALGPAQAGLYIAGGTSAAVVQWAGMMALVNQFRELLGKGPIGFANPAIYDIAQAPGPLAPAFHDITVGNNQLFGSAIGFSAAPGFDLATGWGTPDVTNIVIDLASK